MGTIAVAVKPNSRRPGISLSGTLVEVRVAEPPHDGRANEAVRAALAGALGRPKSAVTLVRGATSRRKVFAVAGLSDDEALRRLTAGVPTPP